MLKFVEVMLHVYVLLKQFTPKKIQNLTEIRKQKKIAHKNSLYFR